MKFENYLRSTVQVTISLIVLVKISFCGANALAGDSELKIKQVTSTGVITKEFSKIKDLAQLDYKVEKSKSSLSSIRLKRLVIIGDTGCRLKESKKKQKDSNESILEVVHQDCGDKNLWPYSRVLDQVKKENADIIIHLGDYHYREQCSSGSLCSSLGNTVGYGLEGWLSDFLEPSKKLLAEVPWVFVRGNHEDCQRAYQGYRLFLSSSGGKTEEKCPDYEDFEIFDFANLILVNFDSTAISEFPNLDKKTQELWMTRLKSLNQQLKSLLLKGSKPVWLLTHKPVYGFTKLGPMYAPVNINLRKFFEESGLAQVVNYIFSGHIHGATTVQPAANASFQFVVGHGGTSLDDFSMIRKKENMEALGFAKVEVPSVGFGYLVIDAKPIPLEKQSQSNAAAQWMATFKDQHGKVESSVEMKSQDIKAQDVKAPK